MTPESESLMNPTMAMRRTAVAAALAAVVVAVGAAAPVADYPRDLLAQARTSGSETKVTSTVKIHLDRLMEPARRTRVLDGLKYNGYQGFMDALRPLPVIGSIATPNRQVSVRYAWESVVAERRRLVVVADKPLFFLPGDAAKARTGYELTFVELLFDDHGAAVGTMAGAARVRPSPDGFILDDFAVAPVELTVAAPAAPDAPRPPP
jgi:hypothetical protein